MPPAVTASYRGLSRLCKVPVPKAPTKFQAILGVRWTPAQSQASSVTQLPPRCKSAIAYLRPSGPDVTWELLLDFGMMIQPVDNRLETPGRRPGDPVYTRSTLSGVEKDSN